MKIFNTTIKVLSAKTMILLTLMLFTQLNHAQGNSPSVAILGTWKVDVAACMASVSADDKELMSTSQDMNQKVQQSLSNRFMTFNQDGTFGQIDGFGNQVNGIWQLQGNTLTITSSSGKVWTQRIVQLTSNTLGLQQAPKGEAQPIIPALFLTKS
jgi:hypothetical protein